MEHVRSNRAAYESSFPYGPYKSLDGWLNKMSRDTEWGDQVAIRALADALQVAIVAVRAEAIDKGKSTIYKLAQLASLDAEQQWQWQALQDAIAQRTSLCLLSIG
ncbi:MAG: OTU domain-containing protein [Bacteroidota bacterium]